MKHIGTKLASAAVFLVVGGNMMQAGIIVFNNFDTGDAFVSGSGATVSNSSQGDKRTSFAFVSTTSVYLRTIDFVTSITNTTPTNTVMLSISLDSGGNPGTALDTMTFTKQMGLLSSSVAPPELHFISGVGVVLAAGNTYWVTADGPNDFASTVVWNSSSAINNVGQEATFNSGTSMWSVQSNVQGVFRVTGDLVPEPGTLALIAGGVAVIFVRRRRHTSNK